MAGKDLYFAVNLNSKSHIDPMMEFGVRCVLFSYFYNPTLLSLEGFLSKVKPQKIMVDSGAFSAWTRGKEVNLDKYIEYCLKVKDFLKGRDIEFYFVSLDIIPGRPNEKVTIKQREAAGKEGWGNMLRMEKAGLKVIPVHHQHESWNIARELAKHVEYMGISPADDLPEADRVKYVRQAFAVVKKTKVKTHGFGATGMKMIESFPWTSLDSSSWTVGTRYGVTYFFRRGKLECYDKEDKRGVRARALSFCRKYGIDHQKLMQDDSLAVTRFNYLNWKFYADKIAGKEESKEPEVRKEKRKLSPEFEARKGKIQEILKQSPELERKRLQKLKRNLFHFKHGRFAKGLPLFCNDCYVRDKCRYSPFNEGGPYYSRKIADSETPPQIYCALRKEFSSFFQPEKFGLRDVKKVEEAKNRLMSVQMTRASMNYYFELLDGGIQDKALTALMVWIYERLAKVPKLEVSLHQNILYQTAIEVRDKFSEERRQELVKALKMEGIEEAEYKEKPVKELKKARKVKEVKKSDKVSG